MRHAGNALLKGMGPMFQAYRWRCCRSWASSRADIGIAPLNRDSGQSQAGRETYDGGRAEVRVAL